MTQKSTIIAIINAVVLLAGWKLDPGRIDALGTVLSILDTIVLAVLQEGPPASPPPPPPACPPDESSGPGGGQ